MRRLAWLLAMALGLSTVACGTDDKPRVNGEGGQGGQGGEGGSGGSGGTPADSTLELPGLTAPARVRFDEQGVLHATCQTDEDCAAVLGYFHAANRFFQMDLQRRLARGRLSELVGTFTLEQDVASRHFMTTRDGTPIEDVIWEQTRADTRSIIEAYTSGVNGWIEDLRAGRNGASLTEDYGVVGVGVDGIADWEPLDTVAFARLMTMQLSESSASELALGAAFPNLPAERAVALFTVSPGARVYTMPASGVTYGAGALAMKARPQLDEPAIHRLQLRLNEIANLIEEARAYRPHELFGIEGDPKGSNNWVVGPSLAGGKTLLANDPHLGLSNPAVWYLAHLDSKTEGEGTLNVAGGSFPGIPGIPIGRNESVAWGATVAFFDVTDVYVETFNDEGTHVLFDANGGAAPAPVAVVEKKFTFNVKGQAAVERTLRWVPHHGPLVAFDQANKSGMSIRWTGHEPSFELDAFLDIARAGTVDEAKVALQAFKVGAQNFVLADTAGKIGWYPHANVPVRPWASFNQADPASGESLPPWMPLPGDGSAEWDGYLPAEQLPQLFDPPKAFIATANQDMTGATEDGDPTNDGHTLLQSLMAPGFREARVVELLEAETNHTVETMLAMQADTLSLPGKLIVPALLEAAAGATLSPRATALVGALADWEYTCPTGLIGSDPQGAVDPDATAARESIGCSAFHYSLTRLFDKAYGDELAAAKFPFRVDNLIRPLAISLQPEWVAELPFDPNVLWDDLRTPEVETRDEIMVAALEDAGVEIANAMGSDPNGWRWGRVHTVTFESALAALDFAGKLKDGPYANDGGLFTVDVANPAANARGKNFQHTAGASLRIVNEASEDGISSWLQLPGGQDLHRKNAHFGDLVESWLNNEPFRLPFTAEEVEAAAQTIVDVMP